MIKNHVNQAIKQQLVVVTLMNKHDKNNKFNQLNYYCISNNIISLNIIIPIRIPDFLKLSDHVYSNTL